MSHESYKAEDSGEMIWLRLNRLKSVKLCEKMIREKLEVQPNPQLTDEVIKNKAVGLASAIDSAIGYWEVAPRAINAKVLSRYYFMLQMTIAEQVSNVAIVDDLKTVQRHTEQGHGFVTVDDQAAHLPENYYVGALASGHFSAYVKSLRIGAEQFSLTKRPKTFSNVSHDELKNLVRLIDLFRRIPEVSSVIEEYTDLPPLSFHVGHSERNMIIQSERIKAHIEKTGKVDMDPPTASPTKKTYVDFYTRSTRVTADFLNGLPLSVSNIHLHDGQLMGEVDHSKDAYWWQHCQTYHSSYATTHIITPLWGKVKDTIVLNFMLLYALSIIVRYRPDHWYQINNGELNHIGSLIEYYTSTIDHVLPLQMLERITGGKISIHQPGSFLGPV